MDIVLHRKDIRVEDNKAVSSAENAIPLFVIDEEMIDESSNRRMKWLRKNLQSLRQDYKEAGSDLIVRRGDPTDVVEELADEYNADRVLLNKSYTPTGRDLGERIEDDLSDHITVESFHDKVLHEPEAIYTNKGTPYSVFTYYHKKWKKRNKEEPFEIGDFQSIDDKNDEIPTLDELGFESTNIELPEAGTEAAKDRLRRFCSEDISDYGEERDYPGQEGTSRLSAYMAYGVIGVRDVWEMTEQEDSASEFQEQLAWRDFYTQVLYHNPSVVTENYKSYDRPIQWENDSVLLQKWKDGETGYPIVDAGMRQLKQEGYMHNRLRMIVASFLTKDLLMDWREGYNWFKKMLIDHDVANNNGGWQWAASTGTDAQPYFRIFNPMSQGERYDPDAQYIKKYVSELQDVDPDLIHSWNELSEEERPDDTDYPAPVIDHSERREMALNMYKRARGEDIDE